MEGIQHSDAELVRRALGARTDQERAAAFEAIAGKYRLIVLRQCAWWYPGPDVAQDVGQAAFEAAFTLLAQGKGPGRPDKLAGWLIEIARLRGREYLRKTKPAGVQWADLPEGRSLDETEDDEEDRSGSASRRAHATRLVDRVVATFTDRQREIYRLRFVQELTGREIAGRLGIADKAASNEATIVQALIADGFGALILMQEGRRYCAGLARIIDDAAQARTATAATATFAAAPADADVFTAVLRQRIVNHFNDCNVCDNCRMCNAKRRQLVGPYAPALIPILFAGEFHDRIDEVIRRVIEQAHAGHNPSSHPESSTPIAAAAGRLPSMAGAAPVLASAAAGSGAAQVLDRRQRPTDRPRLLHSVTRRPVPYAAAAAVIVLIVLAVLLVPHGHPASAAGGKGGTGPVVTTAHVAKVPPAGPDGWAYDALYDSGGPVITVSCPAASFCMAVDNSYNSYIFNGSSWTGPTVVDQAAAQSAAAGGSGPGYISVSCATPRFCAAADDLGDLYMFNGTSWRGPVSLSDYGGLSVSCPASGSCLAMDDNGRAYTYSDGAWTTHKGVAPPAGGITQDSAVYQVSCASASFCAIVSATGSAWTYNGTAFTGPVKIDASSGSTADTAVTMMVSCPSAGFCMAIDENGNAYTFDGASWKVSDIIRGNGGYGSVSCSSASRCMTLDNQGNLFWFTGSAWNLDESFIFTGSSDGMLQAGVSCPSAALCVAVGEGQYGIWR